MIDEQMNGLLAEGGMDGWIRNYRLIRKWFEPRVIREPFDNCFPQWKKRVICCFFFRVRCSSWIYGAVECSDCFPKERNVKQRYNEKSELGTFILLLFHFK